jgi:hypothetical protein
MPIKTIFEQAFLDGNKGSFGRLSSLPFLLSAWGIGTAYGVMQLVSGNAVTEIILLFFSIAVSLYGGSKGLSIIKDYTVISDKTKKGGHEKDNTAASPSDIVV